MPKQTMKQEKGTARGRRITIALIILGLVITTAFWLTRNNSTGDVANGNKTASNSFYGNTDLTVTWKFEVRDGIFSPVAFINDVSLFTNDAFVYIPQGSGGLLAVDKATGEEVWHFDSSKQLKILDVTAEAIIAGSYVNRGDRSLVGETLYSINAATGTLNWEDTLDYKVAMDGASNTGTRKFVDVVNNTVYVMDYESDAKYIKSVDNRTGQVIWKYRIAHKNYASSGKCGEPFEEYSFKTTPKILYVIHNVYEQGDRCGNFLQTSLLALDAIDATALWEYTEANWKLFTYAFDENSVYFSSKNAIVALDNKDGKLVWSSPRVERVDSLWLLGNTLVVDGETSIYAFSKATGVRVWSLPTYANASLVDSIVEGDTAYFSFTTAARPVNEKSYQKVIAVDLSNGKVLWQADLAGSPRLLISMPNSIIVADGSGYLYSFDPDTGVKKWELKGQQKRDYYGELSNWSSKFSTMRSVISDKTLYSLGEIDYAPSRKAELTAVDLETGRVKRFIQGEESFWCIFTDEDLLFIYDKNTLWALE